MRFTRKAAELAEVIVSIEVVPEVESDDSRIAILDAQGEGFEVLRTIDIGRALWRPESPTELDGLERRDVVIVAAYSAEDITSYRPLMARCMTIVLAMGLGPQLGSRALTLGAVGYIDASMDPGSISGAFSDAFARIGTRRQRELVA
jgi:hypothetical protein